VSSRLELGLRVFALVASVSLLTQIDAQTKWIKRVDLTMQPRLWPILALVLMVVSALAMCVVGFRKLRSNQVQSALPERSLLLEWWLPLEYSLWFLAYVYVVGLAGYLLATLGFMLVLTYRAGFREKRWFGWAVVVGLTVVLSFRTALQVRLPSGQLYEFLLPGFRNFMITYF
jgi:hypothetical protein